MDLKNPYFLGETFYGFWLPLPESVPDNCGLSDPIVKMLSETIKLKVLMSFDKSPTIISEQTIFRPPVKDGDLKFTGSVGWKADLSWENQK